MGNMEAMFVWLYLIPACLSAAYVFFDAINRDKSIIMAFVIAALVLFVAWPLGFIFWLILRPKKAPAVKPV
jgi:hypothetical protein